MRAICSLENFPDELLLQVLNDLPQKDVLALALGSKRMGRLCQQKLYRFVYYQERDFILKEIPASRPSVGFMLNWTKNNSKYLSSVSFLLKSEGITPRVLDDQPFRRHATSGC